MEDKNKHGFLYNFLRFTFLVFLSACAGIGLRKGGALEALKSTFWVEVGYFGFAALIFLYDYFFAKKEKDQ